MKKRNVLLLFIFLCSAFFFSCTDNTITKADPPPKGTQYHFNVFGDSRGGNSVYASFVTIALTAGIPAFNVHIGDMISDPEKGGEWPIFEAISRPLLGKPFYPVIGNHDVDDEESLERLRSVFPQVSTKGYYSKLIKTCLCIFLNSEELEHSEKSPGETQMNWLKTQLSAIDERQNRYIAVFVHRPLFPQNHHKDEPLSNYEALHQMMVKFKVPLVFSGHEHSYSRYEKDGIQYIITGSSGSPLFQGAGKNAFFHFAQISVLEEKLIVKIFDLFGRIRDEVEIFI
ncbi:MAG: metallophosphoesterase [SAR324 cluster bacterium]|nr:metallophosphoesterase [SAR324 cluster bacterium]